MTNGIFGRLEHGHGSHHPAHHRHQKHHPFSLNHAAIHQDKAHRRHGHIAHRTISHIIHDFNVVLAPMGISIMVGILVLGVMVLL